MHLEKCNKLLASFGLVPGFRPALKRRWRARDTGSGGKVQIVLLPRYDDMLKSTLHLYQVITAIKQSLFVFWGNTKTILTRIILLPRFSPRVRCPHHRPKYIGQEGSTTQITANGLRKKLICWSESSCQGFPWCLYMHLLFKYWCKLTSKNLTGPSTKKTGLPFDWL